MTDGRDLGDAEAELARYAEALADAIDAVLADWVLRCVRDRCAQAGVEIDDTVAGAAAVAAVAARREVGAAVRELLAADIDDQRRSPLELVRRGVRHPTAVLVAAGVPPVARDDFAERAFPEDLYDLSPAGFGDIDPSLHEPGLAWGAAKAYVHLARHRHP